MKHLTFLFTILISFQLTGQIADGQLAPDFTAVDINGNTHNLYDILAEGKSVVLDFSATWCGPCWSYHTGGSLERFVEEHGPDGTGESIVFMIEADASTNVDCLYGQSGCNDTSLGNWVEGTNYPIIDDASIGTKYQIQAYPTILMVCPDGKVTELGQVGEEVIHNNTSVCPGVETAPDLRFLPSEVFNCGPLEVGFSDLSWPRPDVYTWDFGDGETSSEAEPTHTYAEPGTYTVTLVGSNAFGETTLMKEGLIHVGEGDPAPIQNVGPLNQDIGSGRMFEGGHQGLYLNAEKDMLIKSAFVYSGKDAVRSVTLHDADDNLLSITDVHIPEGDLRVELNIFVPQGEGYRLGLYSDAYMFRNDGGVQFPYEVEGLFSIYESTAGTDPLRYYYYFYDLEVSRAACGQITDTDEVDASLLTVYPNPATHEINIESDDIYRATIKVYDNLGRLLDVPVIRDFDLAIIDINTLEAGVYVLQVDDTITKFQKL